MDAGWYLTTEYEAGWGVTLYILGFGLASQVAQIVDLGVGYGSLLRDHLQLPGMTLETPLP